MTVLVAFAGSGDTSEANIAALLNDKLPQTMEPPVIPAAIKRAQTGLKRTAAWLRAEFGEENVDEVPVKEILQLLTEAAERGEEAFLCYIPAEAWKDDSYEAHLVRGCYEHGIPVLNLALGLADFVPPEEEPQSDEASQGGGPHVPATRGRPRSPQTDAPADPWADTGGESNDREEPAQRQEEATGGLAATAGGEFLWGWSCHRASRNESAPGGFGHPGAASVNLSAATVQALLAFAGSLAEDVNASSFAAAMSGIAQEIGEAAEPLDEALEMPAPDTETLYKFWLHEDGTYRPRTRGRGKAGEEAVMLNAVDVAALGLELPPGE